jgi:hypothetical protein
LQIAYCVGGLAVSNTIIPILKLAENTTY